MDNSRIHSSILQQSFETNGVLTQNGLNELLKEIFELKLDPVCAFSGSDPGESEWNEKSIANH